MRFPPVPQLTPRLTSGLVVSGRAVRTWIVSVATVLGQALLAEWNGSPVYLWLLAYPRARDLGAAPRDFRPLNPQVGEAVLAGAFPLAGMTLDAGEAADPWDRPSPSRRFALEQHQFVWLGDVLAAADGGPREALRLVLAWDRTFGRWNPFSWSGPVVERRVFNLACGLRRL